MPTSKSKRSIATATKLADIQGFAAEFQNESDRATAILAGALLDERLRQLLSNYLIEDEREVTLLIGQEQPLGSFGARLRTAYCLGLLDKNQYAIMLNIKKVRNAFAHELHGLTFEDKSISSTCDELRKLLLLLDGFDELAPTPRSAFILATFTAHLSLWAQTISYEVNGRRCKLPEGEVIFKWSANAVPSLGPESK